MLRPLSLTLLSRLLLPNHTALASAVRLRPAWMISIGNDCRCFSMSKEGAEKERKRRIAVCQMTSTGDREKNFATVKELIEKAANKNAQMIFFPEACDYISDNKDDMLRLAEPIVGGGIVSRYRELARKHNVWLSLGGIHEKDPDNDKKVFNTHVIISSDGEIAQTYRKLHLFDVEIPEKGVRLKESDYATPGVHVVQPAETPVGKVGIAICYDLRFPELATQLALLGADILTYPSAFTHVSGEAHWDILLRCRAVENQCFVIAAAQVGHHNKKRRSYGHALCVDPWGRVLADCGDNAPTYAIAELDYDRLDEVRRNMPVFQHRRNDVYRILTPNVREGQLPEHVSRSIPRPRAPPSETSALEEDSTEEKSYYSFSNIKIRESTVFYATDLTYAFVNIRCVVPGHVLVAPKRVCKRTEDLTTDEINDFFQTVIKVQKVMEKVYNATSSTVTVQDGPEAGQTVQHVHCHVMPRHVGDFKDVDMIYLELAKHDARPACGPCLPLKPPRSLALMREEAALLKSHFPS